MINIFIFIGVLYIALSFWAHSLKKNLKNNSWFVRSVYNISGWIWPVSWQGHLLWVLYFLVFPLTLYISYPFEGLSRLISLATGLIITIGIYFFSVTKSDGYFFSNDKWFDEATNFLITGTLDNKNPDGSSTDFWSYKRVKRFMSIVIAAALLVGLIAFILFLLALKERVS